MLHIDSTISFCHTSTNFFRSYTDANSITIHLSCGTFSIVWFERMLGPLDPLLLDPLRSSLFFANLSSSTLLVADNAEEERGEKAVSKMLWVRIPCTQALVKQDALSMC
jgi:hypothetical protein